MKLEIQRVNQKINKIEELMTTFLEQVSKNSLQVGNQSSSLLVSSPTLPPKVSIVSSLKISKKIASKCRVSYTKKWCINGKVKFQM